MNTITIAERRQQTRALARAVYEYLGELLSKPEANIDALIFAVALESDPDDVFARGGGMADDVEACLGATMASLASTTWLESE